MVISFILDYDPDEILDQEGTELKMGKIWFENQNKQLQTRQTDRELCKTMENFN